jgi:hypothetical protein
MSASLAAFLVLALLLPFRSNLRNELASLLV